MSLGRGAALGLVCAALGAAGWAAVSVATEMRLGFLAIVVGGLAGFGVGLGNRARGGAGAGFLAAVLACVAILGSRYAVMHMGVRELIRAGSEVTPDVAVQEVAAQVYQEFEESGMELDASFYEIDGYPPVVLDEAERRWSALTRDEQQSYMHALQVHYSNQGEQHAGLITVLAVVVDFGLFGFVWVGLGAITAYRIGCAKGEGSSAGWVDPDDAQMGGGGFWARATPTGDPTALIQKQMMAEAAAAAAPGQAEGLADRSAA